MSVSPAAQQIMVSPAPLGGRRLPRPIQAQDVYDETPARRVSTSVTMAFDAAAGQANVVPPDMSRRKMIFYGCSGFVIVGIATVASWLAYESGLQAGARNCTMP